MTKSPGPLYQHVKQHILDKLNSGEWGTNARVYSEKELVQAMNVSRMTANRALRELTEEGYLVRIQGVGTFVAPKKNQSALLEIKNIADEIRERNGRHSCDILLLREEKATPSLAESMEITPGSKLYHSIILHRDNNVPVQLAERYVNPAVVPEYLYQDFTRITPSEYLFSVAALTEAEHYVEAIIPDRRSRDLLQLKKDEACLVLHRRTWSAGQVVTKCEFRYPGSRSQIGGRFMPRQTENLVA